MASSHSRELKTQLEKPRWEYNHRIINSPVKHRNEGHQTLESGSASHHNLLSSLSSKRVNSISFDMTVGFKSLIKM